MADRKLLVALALPIVALLAMVVRAEIVSRGGKPWVIAIRGYDPRDLIRGHYLSYRLDFRKEEPSERCTAATCCYCLRGPAGSEPLVTRINCAEKASCDSWFPESQLDHLQEFYVPEDRGYQLEREIRAKDAKLSVRVSSGGVVIVQDLLLDGRPWRDVVR
ncbi:MAG: GDYXXLXY domain-containing protein [Minicystis sp.]